MDFAHTRQGTARVCVPVWVWWAMYAVQTSRNQATISQQVDSTATYLTRPKFHCLMTSKHHTDQAELNNNSLQSTAQFQRDYHFLEHSELVKSYIAAGVHSSSSTPICSRRAGTADAHATDQRISSNFRRIRVSVGALVQADQPCIHMQSPSDVRTNPFATI